MSYSLDTRNVWIVSVSAVIVVALVFATILVCYRRNQQQLERYEVACVSAGKSIVHGDCIAIAATGTP